jgi:hypothetical protein
MGAAEKLVEDKRYYTLLEYLRLRLRTDFGGKV